jgi:hypothetical protein
MLSRSSTTLTAVDPALVGWLMVPDAPEPPTLEDTEGIWAGTSAPQRRRLGARTLARDPGRMTRASITPVTPGP